MKADNQPTAREYPARPTRVDVSYEAWLKRMDGDVPVQILNVSSRGFRLRSEAPLEAGQRILLAVSKLYPVRAIIRWSASGEAGGEFVDQVAL